MQLALLALTATMALAPSAASLPCTLHSVGGKWEGSCGTLIEGEKTSLSIAAATAITSGPWRKNQAPSAVWAGTITVGDDPPTPLEIEIYGNGTGAMRTVYGWFGVSRLTTSHDALKLEVDSSKEVAPSSIDRDIVQRANEILASDAVWNRADDRKCPPQAATWSIYCAMEKATIEVAGTFHHRRPALEVVRVIVDERTATRGYSHRLMDYNNDKTTHLTDVRSLFAEAIKRIDATNDAH